MSSILSPQFLEKVLDSHLRWCRGPPLSSQRCWCWSRRPHRSLRAYRELLQAPRVLYFSATNRRNDGHDHKDNDRSAKHLRDRNEGDEAESSECVAFRDIQWIANLCSEKYLKMLIGKKEMEDALRRLDKLTQEEARMAAAETLRLSHIITNGTPAC
ncbi:hypothetical protein EDB86DRAFT_1498854 [Lactarius hatsudake]|nr:hypothetical protein EDB86DRAFT_1498854 [Lactarius hatsudake]